MNASDKYVLDANAFIEAKNRYYSFDICPGFWKSLLFQNREGRVCSIDRIENELKVQDDLVCNWIKDEVPNEFFKKTEDAAVTKKYSEMVKWVYSQVQFTDAAKTEFSEVADGWVIAFAAANQRIVVTHETYSPDARRKVPMPNICNQFKIEYVTVFDMLRNLNEKFLRRTKIRRTRR